MEKELNKIKKNAGFLKNKDGSTSDKYVLILFMTVVCFLLPAIICLHWSFKDQPLPQYAFEIIKLLINKGTWIIGFLAGYQSIENNNFYQNIKRKLKDK